jgi:phosphate transport system permease protein
VTAPPVPMRRSSFSKGQAALIAASALSAVCLVWVVFYQLTLLSGAAGFVICSFAVWLLLYWSVSVILEGRLVAKDRVTSLLTWSAAVAMFTPLVIIVIYVVGKGYHYLSLHWFAADGSRAGPEDPPGKAGGLHAVIGTLEQNAIAVALGGPLAILTAVFLNEVGGRLANVVRTIVTAMSGLPAIVAGLFIYTLWVQRLGEGFSGLAAGLSLAIILLPTVTRTTEESLRLIPGGLREASQSLGASEWRTTWSVVLPTARSGMITAFLLGLAITVGETAPVIFTAFGNVRFNNNPFHGPQADLPLVIYQDVLVPVRSQVALGFSTALALLILVFVIFVLARVLGRRRSRGRGPRRRFPTTAGVSTSSLEEQGSD